MRMVDGPMETKFFRCDEPGCATHWNGWLEVAIPPGWMRLDVSYYQDGGDRQRIPLPPHLHLCPEHATALAVRYRGAPMPKPGHETL